MADAKAVGYLELNINGFTSALATAKQALAVFGVSFAAFKTADFWVSNIKGAIDFGNAAYIAGQKMGGFDPGKLLLVRKAFESTGLSAEEANSQINEMLNSHRDFSTFFHDIPKSVDISANVVQKEFKPNVPASIDMGVDPIQREFTPAIPKSVTMGVDPIQKAFTSHVPRSVDMAVSAVQDNFTPNVPKSVTMGVDAIQNSFSPDVPTNVNMGVTAIQKEFTPNVPKSVVVAVGTTQNDFTPNVPKSVTMGVEVVQSRFIPMVPKSVDIAANVAQKEFIPDVPKAVTVDVKYRTEKPTGSGFGAALVTAQKNYGSEADILSKYAEKFTKVEQTISSIVEKGQTFFLALSAQFLEPLYALLNALNQVDLAGIAESLGSAVNTVSNTLIGLFSQGKLTETFKEGLIVAAETFANYLAGASKAFADGLASIVTGINWAKFALGLGQAIAGAFTKGIATLADGMITVAKYFGAGVATVLGAAIAKVLPYLSSVLEPLAKLFGTEFHPENYKPGNFQDNLKSVNETFKPADTYLGALKNGSQSLVDKGVDNVKNSMGKFDFKFAPADLFADLPERSKKLAEALASAQAAGEKLGGIPSVTKANFQALGPQQPLHIIADSLARVGGGGNYIRASLSIAEKEAMKQTEIQRQIAKATEISAAALTHMAGYRTPDGKMHRE